MLKISKVFLCLFCAVILWLGFSSQTQAANINFTVDTTLNFTSVPSTLYIADGSAADVLIVSGTTLDADVPAGSGLTLETTTDSTVLKIAPTGGTASLGIDTTYFSTGYFTQWTASSSAAAASVAFSIKVPLADTSYKITPGSGTAVYAVSDSSSLIIYNYTIGASVVTFTIVQGENPVLPTGGGGGGGGSSSDVTAPTISQITTTVGDTQATISWQTNESSVSWLVYGTTTSYGLEIKTTTSTTSHTLTLSGLSPSTAYHYQVKSQDSSSNIGTYTDQTFTTLTVGAVVETKKEEVTTKPVSQMTVEELMAEINRITALINQLQVELKQLPAESKFTGIPTGFTFSKNLKLGMISDDVKYLQIILNSSSDTKLANSGPGSSGNETTKFGSLTKATVIKFQEKYASEILQSFGLTKGTGLVGVTTRAKLNVLLGK